MHNLLRVILSIVLMAWLVASLVLTSAWAEQRRCAGIGIEVNDSASRRFVTAREIARDLSELGYVGRGRLMSSIDTDSIERFLSGNDKIERVTVVRLTNDSILIKVDPMVPVARVFDTMSDESYYINRSGKHIKAEARYHINVPVITGAFPDSSFTPVSLVPLVDYITADSVWNHFVTMIKVDSPTDVILVPSIKGHVVNLGEPDSFDDKFERLQTIYRKVMPVKGWQYYDTISLKWNGQVVATRRQKPVVEDKHRGDDVDEAVDMSTMLVGDNIAPGQTRPGMKAHGERDIPAYRERRRQAKADSVAAGRKTGVKAETKNDVRPDVKPDAATGVNTGKPSRPDAKNNKK